MRPSKFAAPLAFAALALALCAPALFSHGRTILSSRDCDIAMQFLSWREFGFKELSRGNLALWNPHVYSGIPFFGSFESALLYPPNWLGLFVSAPQAVNAAIALHLFLAGFFTYLWCRGAAISMAGSFLGGALFMLSGPYFLKIYAGHLPPLCAMAWAPALLAAVDAMRSAAELQDKAALRRWTLIAVFAAAMQILAGNPQYVYYTWLALAVYLTLGINGAQARTLVLAYAGVLLGALALCAVQVLGAWDAVAHSARQGFTPEQAGSFSLPPENLATLFLPRLFGGVGAGPQYFGRWYYWDACLFVGASSLVLAACAPLKKEKSARIAAIMVLILIVLALGAYLPSYKVLYHALPGYRLLRGSSKFGFLIALFLAPLAGMGFDALKKSRRALACGLLAAALAELLYFSTGARAAMPASIEFPAAWKKVLVENPGDYRVLHSALRNPNAAMSLGFNDLLGYSQLSSRRYLEFVALSQGQDPDAVSRYPDSLKISGLLGLLRLRFVLREDPLRPVIELPGALPRFSLVSEWKTPGSRRELFSALRDPRFNPTRTVLLEAVPVPAPEPGPGGRVRVLREDSDEIELSAELARAAILVVSDNFSPGWRAVAREGSVQRHYNVMPANHALRAVPLSAGRHHFVMQYAPLGYRLGRWISLLALAAYALFWIGLRAPKSYNRPWHRH